MIDPADEIDDDTGMPKHLPMPVNADGDGPADPEETANIVCWCGVDGCEKYKR